MEEKHEKNVIKVCMLGPSFETGNMGVSALTEGSIKCILNRWPDAEITLLGAGYTPEQYNLLVSGRQICIQTVPIRFSKDIFLPYHFFGFLIYGVLAKVLPRLRFKEALLNHNSYFRTLYEADLVVDITGGDSFSDIYGFRRFFTGFLRKWLVMFLRKKLVLLPQTYGTYKRYLTKMLAKQILSYATAVYSRDQSGIDYVKGILNSGNENGKIKFLPDVGFVIDADARNSTEADFLKKIKSRNKVLVGLNISGLLSRYSRIGDNKFALQVDYSGLVSSIVELMMRNKHIVLLLVPHVIPPAGVEADNDLIACREVYERIKHKYDNRVFLIEGQQNHNGVKYIIGLCDFFLGSRMHACIAALSQGIPAIGLAYSKKFRGVFESVGVEELAVDMRRQGQDEILGIIEDAFEGRDAIAKRLRMLIPDVQARILNMFKDFKL